FAPRRPYAHAGARSQPTQATRGPQKRGVRSHAGTTHRRHGRRLMTWRMALPALAGVAMVGVALFAATAYQTEIAQWRVQREEGLKRDGGWLSVAGLFWLHEGANSFGKDPGNEIVLPDGAARAGAFDLHNGKVAVKMDGA